MIIEHLEVGNKGFYFKILHFDYIRLSYVLTYFS